jgi:hypothetical protein
LKDDLFAVRWSDQSWREVLRLICGMIDERFARELVVYLANLVYEFKDHPRRRALLIELAAQCFAELRNADPALVPGLRYLLWNRGEVDRDPDVRRKAVEVVGKYFMADRDALRFLRDRAIRDLDERWRVRRAAITALNKHPAGDKETMEVFADRAAHDEDPEVRSAAIFALTRLLRTDEQTVLFLHERVAAEDDAYVRGAAVRELGEYFHDDPRIFNCCARTVEDPESLVRYMAVRALVKYFRDEETRALLLDRAAHDPSPPADAPEGHADVRDTALEPLTQ